jgi:hypothetical protein
MKSEGSQEKSRREHLKSSYLLGPGWETGLGQIPDDLPLVIWNSSRRKLWTTGGDWATWGFLGRGRDSPDSINFYEKYSVQTSPDCRVQLCRLTWGGMKTTASRAAEEVEAHKLSSFAIQKYDINFTIYRRK